ncbi:MAG: rhomboid family intramembrane serine protease, partial [Planctomycetes bacterium]|nr:rhomboid family intramembrane serine protease [Planctomycetota bacterium]
MGWQDRDYARHESPPGPVEYMRQPTLVARHGIITTLIAINVGIYVLQSLFEPFGRFLTGYEVRTPLGVAFHHGFAEMWANGVLQGQVWRLFTAQYLHAGLMHLFINMLVLHFLGRPLERLWSIRKLFTVYTLCGLAGNVFYTLLGWRGVINPDMPAVGASGCIYGLLGAVAVLFPTATVYIYFLFPMKIRTAAIIFGGLAFITILQRGTNYGGEACHLAGLVFGVWWAWKGDAWWASVRRNAPRRARVSKPVTPRTRGFATKVAERRADAETIDRILRKVYDGGIHSLSESEKQALQEATERQRQRDREA